MTHSRQPAVRYKVRRSYDSEKIEGLEKEIFGFSPDYREITKLGFKVVRKQEEIYEMRVIASRLVKGYTSPNMKMDWVDEIHDIIGNIAQAAQPYTFHYDREEPGLGGGMAMLSTGCTLDVLRNGVHAPFFKYLENVYFPEHKEFLDEIKAP